MVPLRKPLSLEVPLIGPDRFRQATLPAYRWPFGRWGFPARLVVGAGCIAAGPHRRELTGNLSDRALAPGNLLTVPLLSPVPKALHERVCGARLGELGFKRCALAVANPPLDRSCSMTTPFEGLPICATLRASTRQPWWAADTMAVAAATAAASVPAMQGERRGRNSKRVYGSDSRVL